MISRLLISDLWRFLLPSTQGMGGTPQPSMEKPHAKSPSRVDLNLKPLIQQNHCQCEPLPPLSALRSRSAFSLVELLVVMGIIATMVGLSVLALQGMRAPAVQHAASQVMSGLSLARQVAITKNTKAAFLIANDTTAGFPANGPYRHWSVVYSNKGEDNWTMGKDWEELPQGSVFFEIRGADDGSDYDEIDSSANSFSISPGESIPISGFTSGNSSESFSINGTSTSIPCIIFKSDGCSLNTNSCAIRISPGSVINGNATLTSTNNYYFVETDGLVGRIRMRSPESYRAP
jgi:type II secretory pathway pseudopilin PulG